MGEQGYNAVEQTGASRSSCQVALTMVNGMEDIVCVSERRELIVLSEAPALIVQFTRRFVVIARFGHRK